MNQHQQERRKQRIRGRAQVAAQLMGNMNQLGQYVGLFIGLPLHRRILWLLFGARSLRWFRG